MTLIVREKIVKSVLSKSQVYDYALNPYIGCGHHCAYCYASFMKRFTGHRERWGEFVDVKINAPERLGRELKKRRKGRIWVSGVCDPYQPLEKKFRITKRCLEIIVENEWPFTVQTKSALVLRDIDILKQAKDVEVGFSIATADDKIRKIFEPGASPIRKRIEAMAMLHSAGIPTFAMIAPILPGTEGLVRELRGKVDYVLVDRLNYYYAHRLYKQHGLQGAAQDSFFTVKAAELRQGFDQSGIPCRLLF